MRVYVDLCALKRLFDERDQDRVRIEAEAVALILERVDRGEIELLSSEVLEEENLKNPDPVRRARTAELLGRLPRRVAVTPKMEADANRLQGLGIGGYDSLHVACAMQGGAAALVTCDDRLIRLVGRHAAVIPVRVVSPVDFVRE